MCLDLITTLNKLSDYLTNTVEEYNEYYYNVLFAL